MNGDLEQNGENSESRPQPENKLESIRDVTRAIEDGDEKYIGRLAVIADLLSDVNENLEKLISIGTSVNNHARTIRSGVTRLVKLWQGKPKRRWWWRKY